MIEQYGPCVRVEHKRGPYPSWDLCVQVVDASGNWETKATFNDMASDMAYTNAREYAQHCRRTLIEGERIA
jgi:hypothetical protein